MEGKLRTFLAIEADEALKDQITDFSKNLKKITVLKNIEWCRRENLHITLRFLGVVTADQIEIIVANISEIELIKSFEVTLSKIVIFPNVDKPVAIVFMPEPLLPLMQLNILLEECLAGHDVKREKYSFVPHLTLGKVKSRNAPELPEIELPNFKWHVGAIKLMQSVPSNQGTHYRSLASWKLE